MNHRAYRGTDPHVLIRLHIYSTHYPDRSADGRATGEYRRVRPTAHQEFAELIHTPLARLVETFFFQLASDCETKLALLDVLIQM